MDDPVRWVTAALCFANLCVLVFSAIVFGPGRGTDYVLRTSMLALMFTNFTYSSVAAVNRHLPVQDYNFYSVPILAALLIALLTPWRWRRSWRSSDA
jgi:hypothetical protein